MILFPRASDIVIFLATLVLQYHQPKKVTAALLFFSLLTIILISIAAKRAALPPTSIISYWKPEVSVRLVSDFAKYPYDMSKPIASHHQHLLYYSNLLIIVPEAVSRYIIHSQSRKNGQQQPRYKPALYADEIGLTSDKYIHLNDTVEELPLKISIGPMSTQRWFLMSHLEESFLFVSAKRIWI